METSPTIQAPLSGAALAIEMAKRLRHERFIDTQEINIDATGRVSLPTAYRAAFDSGLARIAPVASGRNLEMWPPDTFELVLEHRRLEKDSTLSSPRALKMLQSRTARVAIDKQYRFVIPPEMRNALGLNQRVVLAGMGEAIEIWSPEGWAEESKAWDFADENYSGF